MGKKGRRGRMEIGEEGKRGNRGGGMTLLARWFLECSSKDVGH